MQQAVGILINMNNLIQPDSEQTIVRLTSPAFLVDWWRNIHIPFFNTKKAGNVAVFIRNRNKFKQLGLKFDFGPLEVRSPGQSSSYKHR